jgi:hypothetical protein
VVQPVRQDEARQQLPGQLLPKEQDALRLRERPLLRELRWRRLAIHQDRLEAAWEA